MFELKLVDIFSTLCVGFITMAIGVFIYFLAAKLFVPKRFDDELFTKWIMELLRSKYGDTWYAVLVIVIVYFAGILAGDLTGRMTDSDEHKSVVLQTLKSLTDMESESTLRKEALINVHTDYSISTLGMAILLNPYIVHEGNSNAGTRFFEVGRLQSKDDVNYQWNLIKNRVRQQTRLDTDFTTFVLEMYYTSKNWVYSKEHEPLHELKDIQNRIDLSRSVVLLAATGLVIILALSVVFTVYFFICRIMKVKPASRYYIPIDVILILFAMLLICRECYHINEMNYLKRAFGYYSSYVRQEQEKGKLKVAFLRDFD